MKNVEKGEKNFQNSESAPLPELIPEYASEDHLNKDTFNSALYSIIANLWGLVSCPLLKR